MSHPSSSDFNPYHKWLGIPPEACPPNHYRLLGLELFEADPEVIATAADRQMAHVKSFSTGPFARVSQMLLNQLSQARLCLLNEQNKRVYDASLQAEVARSVTSAVFPSETVATVPMGWDQPATRPTKRHRRRKKTSLAPFAFLLIGVGAIGGLLYYAATQAPVAQGNDIESAGDDEMANGTAPSAIGPDNSSTPEWGGDNTSPGSTRGFPANPAQGPSRGLGFPFGTPNQPGPTTTPDTPSRSRALPPSASPPRPRGDTPPSDSSQRLHGGPFEDVPAYLTLPELLETGVMEIARIAGSSTTFPIDLELVVADFVERSPRQVFLHVGDLGEWLVFDEPPDVRRQLLQSGESVGALPFAKIAYEEGRITFQWMNDPTQRGQAQRLKSCLLRIKSGTEERVVQLRRPVEESALIDVGRLEEKFLKVIETEALEPLPPTGAMLLALNPLPQLPATRPSQGDPDRLKEEEQLFLQFQRPSYAGIGAYWQLKGRRLTIGISPGFRLESAPNDIIVLSRSKVTEAQTKLVAAARRTEKDHATRVNSRRRLQNNLTAANNLNIRLPGGGTTPNLIAQKKLAIDKAQRDIAANEARITHLAELRKAVKSDMDTRIPALASFVDELENNALFGFELYVPAGAHRVLIYRQGVNGDDTAFRSSRSPNLDSGASQRQRGSAVRSPFDGL